MDPEFSVEIKAILQARFGKDCTVALATVDGSAPSVRTVNAYYENRAFYVITSARSNKMKEIAKNPAVAIAGDWFTAHGIAEDLGAVLAPSNAGRMATLRTVFSAWYGNGHVREDDPDTHLLSIRLTDGVLYAHGTRYDLRFGGETDGREENGDI